MEYSLFLEITSFLFFLIPILYAVTLYKNTVKIKNAIIKYIGKEKKDKEIIEGEKKFEREIKHKTLLIVGGCLGLGVSVFFFGKLIECLYIKETNIILSLTLMPIAVSCLLYFLFVHFSEVSRYSQDDLHSAKFTSIFALFPSARTSIEIYSGTFSPAFYGDERVRKALAYLKEKGIKIDIWGLNPELIKDESHRKYIMKKVITPFKKDGLYENLHFYNKEILANHIMLIDGKRMRIEKKHPPKGETGLHVKGRANSLYFWNPWLAFALRQDFKKLTKHS